MIFLESDRIDREKWDNLVREKGEHFFSDRRYLDAVAENWGVYILDDYRGAIVIPYRYKLGFRWVYQPDFYRASEWLGEWNQSEKDRFWSVLRADFSEGYFALEDIERVDSEMLYQTILPDEHFRSSYNKLAVRMIKKAENSTLEFTSQLEKEDFFRLILEELSEKTGAWNPAAQSHFTDLVKNFSDTGDLEYYGAVSGGELVGGIIVLARNNRKMYLKGTARERAKKSGAMYWLMDKAIENAVNQKCIFDFGGSRIEGVRRFNTNFGAQDIQYRLEEWSTSPFWFRAVRNVRNTWKKIRK